mmetsp:Transcript_9022/g.9069  ORF Transcript_9022/g.9069 Transcript_9022/m.9069 type:complete len:754 (+) Transcript_9022:119-2380(+)
MWHALTLIATLLVSVILRIVHSQDLKKAYEIPFTVDGRNFMVRHEADQKLADTADSFCRENSEILGISSENIMACVTPVTDYLTKSLEQQKTSDISGERTVVTLNIKGVNYEVNFQTDDASIMNAATSFCRENASVFGVSDSTISDVCVTPVSQYLKTTVENRKKSKAEITRAEDLVSDPPKLGEAVSSAETAKDVLVPLQIGGEGGMRYEIRFNPSTVSPAAMASTFCSQQATAIGITADAMPGCVKSVSEYLYKVLQGQTGVSERERERQEESVSEGLKQETSATTATTTTSTGAEQQSDSINVSEPVTFQVTVKIGEKEYDISFQPSVVTAEAAAASFCRDEGGSFGITAETLGDCVRAVSEFLTRALKSRKADPAQEQTAEKEAGAAYEKTKTASDEEMVRALSVTLSVMGNDYDITFRPEVTSAATAATTFCSERATEFGLIPETLPACVGSVRDALAVAMEKELGIKSDFVAQTSSDVSTPEKTGMEGGQTPRVPAPATALKVMLSVNEKPYDITFQPNVVTTEAAATSFCRDQGAAFGITPATFSDCVASVSKFLADAVAKNKQSLTETTTSTEKPVPLSPQPPSSTSLTVTLNIMEKDYEIAFEPAVTSSESVASSFCTQHSATFGLTESTLMNCIQPVSTYLTDALLRSKSETDIKSTSESNPTPSQTQTESKTYTIAVTIEGKTYEIAYQPALTTANATANAFCLQQSATFKLTEATLDSCVGPVASYLVSAVNELSSSTRDL